MFYHVWYYIAMNSTFSTKMYTPEQVAQMLQLSKNTVYELISRREIVAKRIGKVYRIPARSISFVFTGLDDDLTLAEEIDQKSLPTIHQGLSRVRSKL